jgi:hypothetical protein
VHLAYIKRYISEPGHQIAMINLSTLQLSTAIMVAVMTKFAFIFEFIFAGMHTYMAFMIMN